MKSFEREYFDKFVVNFNNSNEYIEMGPLDTNPKFTAILIRKKFSESFVELNKYQIQFFLNKIKGVKKSKWNKVRMIHRYGYNEYSSDILLLVTTYNEVRCKFFIGISHQYHLSYDTIRTKSPEFKLEEIKEILEDAYTLIANDEEYTV